MVVTPTDRPSAPGQPPGRARARRRRRQDAGETLVELLLTIMIMSIGVVTILGAVRIAVDASSLDRRQARAQSLLRSWAEGINRATTDAAYVSCAGSGTYTTAPFDFTMVMGAAPTGFTPAVSQVEYWDGAAFGSTCGADTGVQRVTLSMTVSAALYPGFTSTQTVVVRKPCNTLVGGLPTC